MSQGTLAGFIAAAAAEFGIPGAAVGVWHGGREVLVCHGVTSTENPLPVDGRTLFQLGSVTKTYTATALVRLAEEGLVDLAAPVHRYVPELALASEEVAGRITVRNLLNHTAGLDWNLVNDTGEGDDALAAFVADLGSLPLIAAPGTRASYSQAGYNLAGRIIENVTGLTYERAVDRLVLEPLALRDTLFATGDVMTRRFAVGHELDADGAAGVTRPWKGTRGNNPGGGISSSVADQLRWARFHLGDGRGHDGAPVLPADALHRMRQPTVPLIASTLGDAIGTGWFLRDVDGVRTVGHGGSGFGQFAELLIVPERDFAVVVASNAGPDAGLLFNRAVVRWVLEHHLGVVDRDPEPLPHDAERAGEILGDFENDVMALTITTDGRALALDVRIKPEIRAASDTDLPPDLPPADLGLLPGDADEYVLTNGGLKGQRGCFTRDASGAVIGVDLAGRLFTRTGPTPG
ncbi:serine hydrolase domain-containing protein [Streptomyces sp. NPDC057939]|uniref:serine hydrolase domain-containing protein n=1 Tax=Streptomyces sp. NPDC057939 TaxID=3346284 RepID=UPI0036EC0F39